MASVEGMKYKSDETSTKQWNVPQLIATSWIVLAVNTKRGSKGGARARLSTALPGSHHPCSSLRMISRLGSAENELLMIYTQVTICT